MSRLWIRIILKFLLVSQITSVSSEVSSVCPSFSVMFLVGLKYVMVLGCQVMLTSEGLVWVVPVPAMGVQASAFWGGGWESVWQTSLERFWAEDRRKPWGSLSCLSSGGGDGAVKGSRVFHSWMELSSLLSFPVSVTEVWALPFLHPVLPSRRLC